jgi:4,5-dihydroxyphthalate decarboxylase
MSRLKLSVAVGDYDRTRPLVSGAVQIDGVDPIYMTLSPEEIFFRAFRSIDFDVCELSLSSFTVKTAAGTCPYVGIPAFLSRTFRHNSLYVRTDRVKEPRDLIGKRVGLPEYQLTANVWARAMLEEEYGVKPSDITWVRAGIETAHRVEKIAIQLPEDVKLVNGPPGKTISELLRAGEIDGFIAPRPPKLDDFAEAKVAWLFPDPMATAKEFYAKTGIFPIMHILGLRKELAHQHPWLPMALLKAFDSSKRLALEALSDTGAPKVTLPFMDEQLKSVRELFGDDYWPYGIEKNRQTLEYFLRHHRAQGLSSRPLMPEDLFHPSTLETFSV